jgi:hypothetical protein
VRLLEFCDAQGVGFGEGFEDGGAVQEGLDLGVWVAVWTQFLLCVQFVQAVEVVRVFGAATALFELRNVVT